jgi:hypothetical protein
LLVVRVLVAPGLPVSVYEGERVPGVVLGGWERVGRLGPGRTPGGDIVGLFLDTLPLSRFDSYPSRLPPRPPLRSVGRFALARRAEDVVVVWRCGWGVGGG